MKHLWVVAALGVVALGGCKTGPKRDMRPAVTEEFSTPPESMNAPPQYDRDAPALTPKATTPGISPGPGVGSPSGPGTMPSQMGQGRR